MKQYYSVKKLITCLAVVNLSAVSVYAKTSSDGVANSAHEQSQHGAIPADRCKALPDSTVRTSFTRGTGGHILVNGQFNNHKEVAVVDTGGIGVGGVISEKVIRVIQPKDNSQTKAEVQGANHSQPMKMTALQSVGIGGALSNKLNFVVSPGAIIPDEAEALIGSEYLCSFMVEFNFKTNQLVLHPKNQSLNTVFKNSEIESKPLIWGTISNQSNIAGAIVLDMMINNKPVKGVLDTGARHSIMNWKAAKLMGLNEDSSEIIVEENQASGIHGNAAKESYRIKVDQLGFANTDIISKNLDIRISDMGSFKPLVGDTAAVNLGVDFFEGRRLIIDYANRQVAVSN